MADLRIRFIAPETANTDKIAKAFKLELDNEKNNGRTEFGIDETAYVNLYPGGLTYSLRESRGEAWVQATRLPEIVEEEITFTRDDTCSLRQEADKIIEYGWMGRQGPEPVFQEDSIHLPEPFSGILYVKYQVLYDRIAVKSGEPGRVLIEAFNDERYGHITINFGRPEQKQVFITIRDACTREAIDGVKVWLNDRFIGVTDEDGRLALGELRPGTYKIRTQKDGYQANDQDTLRNEEIIIE